MADFSTRLATRSTEGAVAGKATELGSPSVNPVKRKQPSELIATGIAGIDLNNTLVTGRRSRFSPIPTNRLIR
jgi:vacuolar-type H+-ATPase subunit B/Vma2